MEMGPHKDRKTLAWVVIKPTNYKVRREQVVEGNNTGHHPLWNKVKVIDRDPHCYTHRVKEAIHIRLHPDNINRDSGIEIPEAWMPMIKNQQQENRTTADR